MVARGTKCAAVTDNHLSSNRIERGAKVLHRFQRDDVLSLRLDTKGPELLQIEYLAGDCYDQHLNTSDTQNSTGAETTTEPMDHWPVTGETPVADPHESPHSRRRGLRAHVETTAIP